jgi:hypothetical protein
MNLTQDYQRRMESLTRAEIGRTGRVPVSFASLALARRMVNPTPDCPGAVDPITASVPDAKPWLLRA